MTTKTFLLATAFVVLISCNDDKQQDTKVLSTQTTTTPVADVQSLMSSFSTAWNKKDSVAVTNMIADDALLISGRSTFKGKKEIADRWVHHNMPVAGNLKLNELQTNTGADIANTTGTWSVDITVPGRMATSSSGNHTFVWKKSAGDSWQLVLLNMEDHDPESKK